jgi:hypothetical protein
MVRVTGAITPTAPLTDLYPTHDSFYGLGGLREVGNTTARNNIPNARRREGMIVYTVSDMSYWQLKPGPWLGTDFDWKFLWGDTGPGQALFDAVVIPEDEDADIKLQEAIDEVAALPQGGMVWAKSGFYGLTNPIHPRTNVTIMSGGNAVFQNITGWPPGAPSDDIDAACIIQDDGTDFHDFVVQGITFQGNRTLGSTSCAIHLSGDLDPANISGAVIENLTIRDCNFRHMQLLPVKLFGLRGKMIVTGNEFYDNADPGFGFCQEVILVANHSLESHDNGFSLSRGNRKVICVGNTIESPNLYGIWLAGYLTDEGPTDFVCCGNVVLDARRSGINLSGTPKNASITGNFIDLSHNRPIDGIDGIQVYGNSSTQKAENITIVGNTIMNAPRSGVGFANCKVLTICANTIINTGTEYKANGTTLITASDVTSNIGIMSTQLNSVDVWIDGNHIIDNRTTPLCNWDIWKINSSASGILVLGVNHSRGMRSSRNTMNFKNMVDAGQPLDIDINGPDASPMVRWNMQGNGEMQFRGGLGVVIQSVTQGTGSTAYLRFSAGTSAQKIGGFTAKRTSPFGESIMALNCLAGGVLSASDSTAPFYMQGMTSGGFYAGFNSGIRFRRRAISDSSATMAFNDYVIAYTALTTGRSVQLQSTVQVSGQTIIIKDETGNASPATPITINPYSMGSPTFTDADVDPTTNIIHLSTFIATGTPVTVSTPGTLPAPLLPATPYYVTRNTANVASSQVNGGTLTSDSSSGVGAWSNPSNASGSDNSYATWTAVGAGEDGTDPVISQPLKALNNGFAIPAAAQIEGIQVKVEGKSTTVVGADNLVYDANVQLVKGGVVVGDNKATGSSFTSSDTTKTYGDSNNDLWGTSFTPAQINAADFGAIFQASSVSGTMNTDNVIIIVYYTLPNDIKLADTLAHATAGTALDLTTAGSGTVTLASPAQLIEGASSIQINMPRGCVQLYADGLLGWQVQGGIYNTSQFAAANIGGLTEAIQDTVAAYINDNDSMDVSYDDTANTLDLRAQAVSVRIAQTAHGLAVGNVIRHNGTNFVKARADSLANANGVMMVTTVPDANNFTAVQIGYVTGLSGLTAGTTYYLDPTTAGAITATEPVTAGQVSKPVLLATSTTAGFFSSSYRGALVVSASVAAGSGAFLPADVGLLAASIDPATTTTNSGALPNSQMVVIKLRTDIAISVANIVCFVQTAGATLTAGQSFAALYDSSKTLVGQTADQSTAWTTTGLKNMALAGGPFSIPAGYFYVAFVSTGTTRPTLRRSAGGTSIVNGVLSTANSRFANADTGITTTLPSTLGTFTALSEGYFAGVL